MIFFILKPKPSCCRTDTLVPNGGFESLCQSVWFLFPSVRGDVSPGPTRLLLQLALIVLCTSRKAAVNTDHNAVRIRTQGEDGQDRCGAFSQDYTSETEIRIIMSTFSVP